MKKLFVLLSLGTLFWVAPFVKAFDQKDKALLIGATTTLVGGELIRQAIVHNKDLYHFFKDKPHVLIAGIAISIIAARQYKDAVINPLVEWYKTK